MKRSFNLLALLCVFTALSFAQVTVHVTSPTAGATVSSPVALKATASSTLTVTAWRVYLDSVGVYKAGTGSSISTSVSMTPGTHKITVRAWASNGTSGSSTLYVTAGSSGGTQTVSVHVTSPTAGATVSSPVALKATASSTLTVTAWRVYLDSVGVYKAGTGSSISTSLSMTPGSHKITVRAWASNGTSGSSTLYVTAGSSGRLSYYVSTTGNDSNDGRTPQTAWRTIQHAASSIQLGSSGTVVHVAPGTYTGSISTSKAGSATARIRYISDSKWGARLTGGSSVMWSVHGSYTDIVGFEFDGSVYSSCCAVATYSTTNVWILNNKIHDTAKSGNTTSNAVILLNADISSSSITTSKNVVDGNLIYHNNGGATGSTPNNGGQHGIYSQAAGDIIRNNIVLDQGGGWCIVSWHKVSNWTVVNNTMANCPNGGIDVGDDTATGVVHNNDTIVNNIVVNSGNSTTNNGGIDFRQCGSGNVVQNNLMYGNIPANYVGSCGGATLSGTQSGSNFTTFNNYTGTGSGDYRYPSGSTAIDHGTTSCASGASPCVPNNDADGGARPQGAAIDIGSYESGAVPATWPW